MLLHPDLAREVWHALMAHEARERRRGRTLPKGWRETVGQVAAGVQQAEPDEPCPAWLTLDQAAARARVSLSTLYRWRREGLPAHRHRGRVIVARDDLDTWVRSSVGQSSVSAGQSVAAGPDMRNGRPDARPDPVPPGTAAPEDHP